MEEKKQKEKLIKPASVILEMEELERFNGTTEQKIVENWYELKRRLASLLAENAPNQE